MRRGVLTACKAIAMGAARTSAPVGAVNVRMFASSAAPIAHLSAASSAMRLPSNQIRCFSQSAQSSAAPAAPAAPSTPPAAPAAGAAPAAPAAPVPEIPKVYVANLNWRASNDDLHQLFSPFGKLVDAFVVMDRENPNRSRGFGFVTFTTMDEANKAVAALDQKPFLGRPLKVNISIPKPREERPQYGLRAN